MASASPDHQSPVESLRLRFPDAERSLIEDALHCFNNDVLAASNLLMEGSPAEPPRLEHPVLQELSPAPTEITRMPSEVLRLRFLDAERGLIEDALLITSNDVHAAANLLIDWGCKQGGSVQPPPLDHTISQVLSHAPPETVQMASAAGAAASPGLHNMTVSNSWLPPDSAPSSDETIQKIKALSLQEFEQEQRSRKIHVFVDLSNVAIGAQVGRDGKRDTSIRINVGMDLPAKTVCDDPHRFLNWFSAWNKDAT
jgi:hypothetical protein